MNNLFDIIRKVIDDNYVNKETQYKYDTKTQRSIIAVRRGVLDSCSSIINCSDNEDERQDLIRFTRELISDQEEQGVQELR